jgi:hypothetical protein
MGIDKEREQIRSDQRFEWRLHSVWYSWLGILSSLLWVLTPCAIVTTKKGGYEQLRSTTLPSTIVKYSKALAPKDHFDPFHPFPTPEIVVSSSFVVQSWPVFRNRPSHSGDRCKRHVGSLVLSDRLNSKFQLMAGMAGEDKPMA